ncbi:MAG: LysM peptidoglycan-binding domain-containing protein [Deltaproteobacteria bacterium]|nr:LysM peptidoglycan-binding domain-containing protein [Deltaproteobacteria bacterium]
MAAITVRLATTAGLLVFAGAAHGQRTEEEKAERSGRDQVRDEARDFKKSVKKKVWRRKPIGEPDGAASLGGAATGRTKLRRAGDADDEKGDDAAPADAPDVYTIQAGDTLWDLCAKFLANPYYWPRVWSYNPEITNPHWIYPGEEIRFRPSTKPRASILLEGREATTGGGGLSTFRTKQRSPMTVDTFVLRNVAILPEKMIQDAGKIANAFTERHILSQADEAYIEFKDLKKVRAGDQFSLVRLDRPIVHPVTKKRVGYFVRIMGDMKILSVEAKVAKAIIGNTYDAVEREHKVVPYLNNRVVVKPVENKVDLKGYVLDTLNQEVLVADQQVIMMDKGSADKVERGNRFTIVRRGDGMLLKQTKKTREKLPFEDIGVVMIIATDEKMSVGIVARSSREIEPGDLAEMRRETVKGLTPVPEKKESDKGKPPSTAPPTVSPPTPAPVTTPAPKP